MHRAILRYPSKECSGNSSSSVVVVITSTNNIGLTILDILDITSKLAILPLIIQYKHTNTVDMCTLVHCSIL